MKTPLVLGLVAALAVAACALGCSSGSGDPAPFTGSPPPTSTGAPAGDAAPGLVPPSGSTGGAPLLGEDGGALPADAGSSVPGVLTAILRDFRVYDAGDPTTDPDFENPPFNIGNDGGPEPGFIGSWYDTEIVAGTLGADQTPDYKHPGQTTVTTHGADAFQKWFHDTPGTNVRVSYPITLHPNGAGVYGYDSETDGVPYNVPGATGDGFFPIDDGSQYQTPFGNQGYVHNYSFTMEIHTVFTYRGGEFFQFRGDDDVFVFINKALVINLGGIHDAQPAQVSLDTLGLTVGQTYPLDFFSAERHVYGSNIEISTTLALAAPPPK